MIITKEATDQILAVMKEKIQSEELEEIFSRSNWSLHICDQIDYEMPCYDLLELINYHQIVKLGFRENWEAWEIKIFNLLKPSKEDIAEIAEIIIKTFPGVMKIN